MVCDIVMQLEIKLELPKLEVVIIARVHNGIKSIEPLIILPIADTRESNVTSTRADDVSTINYS